MIALSRARPVSITLFAFGFFGSALLAFLEALASIPDQQIQLGQLLPALNWSRDAVIIWQSAWLSIALIPIAMVWMSAVRFARWMVTIMAVPKLFGLLVVAAEGWHFFGMLSPVWLLSQLLALAAVALLFTPASNRWFAERGEVNPAVFD
jgi:hypothetical protein